MRKQERRRPMPVSRARRRLDNIAVWARRHDRLAVVVGAFIVFATFVVKDAIREHFKDLADSTDRARAAFINHQDMRGIRQEIQFLGRRLFDEWRSDGAGPGLTPQRVRDVCEDGVRHLIRPTMNNLYQHRSELWRLVEFARQLPSAAEYESQLTRFDAALVNVLGHGDAILSQWYLDSVSLDTFSQDQLVTTMLNLGNASAELSLKTSEIVEPLDKLRQQIIEDAQKVRDTAKARYDWATGASYALYVLGWAIGFVGRVLGVPTSAGEPA